MLVLTTDGFFEASNPDDEQFGVHALGPFIRDQHTLPPDELIKKLYRRFKSHAADLTAPIVKRTMTRGDSEPTKGRRWFNKPQARLRRGNSVTFHHPAAVQNHGAWYSLSR